MADVTDMLARAEADLREAEAASAAADARAAAAQAEATDKAQRAQEMRAVLDWLRARTAEPAAPARREGHDGELRFGRPVPENPITQLSLDALEAMGGSGSNKQVRERLARDGHDFSQGQVRAALRYLSKKSDPPVTTQQGTGMWRLTRPRPPAIPAANGVGVRP